MEFPIVTMAQMSLAVRRWNRISVIKRNISDAKLQESAFRLLGIVTGQTTATIIRTNRIVDRSRVQIISSSAKTRNVYSRLMFAMAKTIVAITRMNLTNSLALRHRSDAPSANGNVPALQHAAST